MYAHHLTNPSEHYPTSSTRPAWQGVVAQPFSSHQYHDNPSALYPIAVPSSGLDSGYSLSPSQRDAATWSHGVHAAQPAPAPQDAFPGFPPPNARVNDAETLSDVAQTHFHKPSTVKDLPWDHHKKDIHRYYMEQKKKIKELQSIMSDTYKFHATEKQYKDKFKLWGWRRNLRKQEGLFMKSKALERQQQKPPKDTVFEWGGQEWSVDRVLRSFGTELQPDSINEYFDQPTPFGMTYRTPGNYTSSNIVSTPATAHAHVQSDHSPPTNITNQASGIRLRWNGHKAADIPNIMEQAMDLERQKDFDGAADKFAEVLDACRHLLQPADELAIITTYVIAQFQARQCNMAKADTILDDLTKQIVTRWGQSHERTMQHYAIIIRLFETWDRHDDVLHLIKRLTNDFKPSLPLTLAKSQDGHAAMHIDAQTLFESSRLAVNTASSSEDIRSFDERFLRMEVASEAVIDLESEDRPEKKALRLLERLMQSPENNLADIVKTKQLLVRIYMKAVMDTEAREAFTQAKDSVIQLSRLNGSKPKEFFTSATDLAEYGMKNDYANDSHVIFEVVEAEVVTSFGADHAFTISLLVRIGKVIEKLDNWENARPHFRQAYAACITAFGYDSLLTLKLERALEEEHYPDGVDRHDLNKSVFEAIIM